MNTKALRQKVLDLAIHGKLVPQNPNDESATVLLEKIRAEKAEKIKKGELKTDKKDSFIFTKECEFDEDKLGKCSSGTRHKRHYEQFADGTVKDIEDEIPFDVPEGWAWCRLRNIGEYKKGPFGSSLTKSMFVPKSENTVKVYEQKNAIQKDYSLGEYYITRDYFESQMQSFEVFPGDILVSCAGTIGETYILPDNIEQGIINQALMKMKITSLINTDYFLMFFDHILKEESANNGKGTAIKNIPPFDIFKNFLFPLPSYSEQKRIIESVNNIFSIIDNLENNKSDLQSLIKNTKSKILDLAIHGKLVPQDPTDEPAEELLKRIATSDNRPYEKVEEEPFEIPDSWKWVKLNDLAEIARGGSPRPIQYYITDNQDGINWIKIGDTSEKSKYITSSKEKIKPEGKKHSRYVHAGDFLLTNSMSFGRPYILKIDGCIHDGWLVFANIKECLLQDYLYYALSSTYIYETFSNVAAGSTVKNLKSDTVKQVDFPLPPLSEQRMIVKAIENMYEVLDQIQNNFV